MSVQHNNPVLAAMALGGNEASLRVEQQLVQDEKEDEPWFAMGMPREQYGS